MDAKEQMFRGLELFAGCSRRELEWLAKHGDVVDVRPGTRLTRAGGHAHEFCVVVDGFIDAAGEGAAVTLGPDSYFGHVEITSDRPHAITLTSKGAVRLVAFEARAFRGFAECAPSVLRRLFGEVAARVPVGPVFGRRLAAATAA